jgi:CBS-domain-containing membrane protein
MRAHQIMTRPVITVLANSTIVEAADIMLRRHISGFPVVDAAGKLIGIVSEGDFIRRSEIGTQRRRSGLLNSFSARVRRRPIFSGKWPTDIRSHDK